MVSREKIIRRKKSDRYLFPAKIKAQRDRKRGRTPR